MPRFGSTKGGTGKVMGRMENYDWIEGVKGEREQVPAKWIVIQNRKTEKDKGRERKHIVLFVTYDPNLQQGLTVQTKNVCEVIA